MALADIIGRIESDAGAEARALLDGARAKAEAIIADAVREGEREHHHTLTRAKHDAEARAATLLANARLSSRDAMLSAKRALLQRVLTEAEDRLLALDDAAYARLIAGGIVAAAHGGDVVHIAENDRARLSGLEAAVKAAAAEARRTIELTYAKEPADIAHGVLLEADRVSAEISPASMVQGRRSELMAIAAAHLFPEEEA